MSDSKPSLGVVAICYNEEKDLPAFLDHLLSWVDEIVLVDDGSTDGTVEIAKSAGEKVRVIESPRKEGEYFSDQRNKGIAAATADWLLHMDIDERVPPALAKEITSAIRKGDKDAFRFGRLNYFMHRPMRAGGWDLWNQVHLARRSVLSFGGMYHEDCVVEVGASRIGQLESRIAHLNEDDFKKRLKKSDVYLEELVENLHGSGAMVNGLFLVTKPVLEFSKKYFFKRGFSDGIPGLIAAMHSACAVFRAHALVWDQQNRIPREDLEKQLKAEWQAAKRDSDEH